MVKKYIQNCTGEECIERKSSKNTGTASALISRIMFYLLLIGFVLVSVYMFFLSPYLQISNIKITGTREINSEEVRQKIESSLNGKYFGVIPKNNLLFVSQKRIEDVLTGYFKKIRTVSVMKKFPDSVSLNIDERKALLVWCGGEKCFLLDENGTAYSEADFNSPEFIQNHLLQINDSSGREVLLGEKVIDSAYEKYVLDVRDALSLLDLDVIDEYKTPSRIAEEIRIGTSQGSQIYFSLQFPLESAIFTLDTVFKKEIPVEKRGEIEYIDLRNENKVFYKFKNIEPIVENSTEIVEVKI